MKTKMIILAAALAIAAVVTSSSGAFAKSGNLSVLNFYLAIRPPKADLAACVEPYGDDYFAGETRGLSRVLSRIHSKVVSESTPFNLKKIKESQANDYSQEEDIFKFYSRPADPKDYFNKKLLLEIAKNTDSDLLLMGVIQELKVEAKNVGDEPYKVTAKVSYLIFEAATGDFVFSQTFERSTDDAGRFPEYYDLAIGGSGTPEYIRQFADCEIGKVFFTIMEDFMNAFKDSDVSHKKYRNKIAEDSENNSTGDDSEIDAPPAPDGDIAPPPSVKKNDSDPPGQGRDALRSTDVAPPPSFPFDETKVSCINRNQGFITAVEGGGGGIKNYSCKNGGYNFSDPQLRVDVPPAGNSIGWLSSGDIDGDGIDEVIVSSAGNDGKVFVYKLSSGGLTAGKPDYVIDNVLMNIDRGVRAVAGDFDGDKKAEIAITRNGPGDQTKILKFDKDHFVTSNPIMQLANIFGGKGDGAYIAAGDFDGDGKKELAVSSDGAGEMIDIYALSEKNSAPTQIAKLRDFFGGKSKTTRIAAADLDLDGKDELIIATGEGQLRVVAIAFRDGKFDFDNPIGEFSPEWAAKAENTRIFTGDLNGDRQEDVIITVSDDGGRIWAVQYRGRRFYNAVPYFKGIAIRTAVAKGVLVTAGTFH